MEPDAVEIRVLGCLIEKQRTTPDVYPLSLNSLRLACNQSTNRDPVVDYDEGTVHSALDRLMQRKWATLASWAGRRSMKYRQVLDRNLELGDAELSLLGILMLRGPQTPGELRARSDRLHRFESAGELEETLQRLIDREMVQSLGKRPGQREGRFRQILGAEAAEESGGEPAPDWSPAGEPVATPELASQAGESLTTRVEQLEREVAELRDELRTLREELGA